TVDALLDDDPAAPPTRATPPLSGPAAVRVVAAACAPDDVLLVGASNPVRDLDLVARWAEPPLVLANRGLAGIDGTLSTAAGVALGLPHRRVRALVGDLTFLHDVGGLLRPSTEAEPDLQVVVLNDGGGSIFATLEHGAPERARTFERVFGTPHTADLAALCAGYGVRHVRVSDPVALAAALAAPGRGTSVVEVRVDRADRRALDQRLAADVRTAIRTTLTDAP
ncbi:thiamine pyrophosphate-binding protein, partial [Cellulomonas triticagri]